MPRPSSIAPLGASLTRGRIHGIEQPLPADLREDLAQLLAAALVADIGRKNENGAADGSFLSWAEPKGETDGADAALQAAGRSL